MIYSPEEKKTVDEYRNTEISHAESVPWVESQ
jgi:hypothetical protein